MFGASFLTNDRPEARMHCQSFGRLIRSVEGLSDPNTAPVVVHIDSGDKMHARKNGKTAVVDFSIEGVQEEPLCVSNLGLEFSRAYEVFNDQAAGQSPVCMFVKYNNIDNILYAVKEGFKGDFLFPTNLSAADIDDIEQFLQHYFRYDFGALRHSYGYNHGSIIRRHCLNVDELALFDPNIPKLADVIFSVGGAFGLAQFDQKADIYFQVNTTDPDNIWKGRVSNIVVSDRPRFQTVAAQRAWD